MADSVVSSFWGPVTSTIELCEENYTHSSYIAEFYNTMSNVPSILLALIGLINALRQRFEKRFSVLHISNMILAIGSMIFHATLQLVMMFIGFLVSTTQKNLDGLRKDNVAVWLAVIVPSIIFVNWTGNTCRSWLQQLNFHSMQLQQSDETPMVWEMLLYIYVLYSPDWHYRSTMPTFLFLYGAAFAVVHSLVRFQIAFKVHYIVLCLLCIPRMYKYYIQTKERGARRLAKLYVATILLGTLCWLFDRIFCKKLSHWYINPQGHAWWHVLMGFNSYFANTFLMFCRAQQLGWQPQVAHLFGFFPYVKIQKPKKQE